MNSQLTEEQIRLTTGSNIIENPNLTIEDLGEKIFGDEETNIPSIIKSFVREEFLRQMKNYCRFQAKSCIASNLKMGSSEFIQKFITAQQSNKLVNVFPRDLQSRLIILQKENELDNLLIEYQRLFNRLRDKYVPVQNEDRFRNFLTQWLQSGFMSLSFWKIFSDWKRNEPSLAKFKQLQWPSSAEQDSNWRELQRLIKLIKTDNFVEMTKLKAILDLLLSDPKISTIDSKIKVIGRTIYLSDWKKRIEDEITSKNATQISIFAEDSLGIDCDLVGNVWQGKNLIIVSKVVYVWQNSKIILSGKGFQPGKTKAANATTAKNIGSEGKDGQPGESSGNITILATKMFNSLKLTVELNGGRGEDGQDGGDGCDGKNGVGVTKSDLDNLVVSYYSLYRDYWSNFYDYAPPSNWTKTDGNSSSGEYIYRTYEDEHGRVMTYSYAADKGWVYSAYDLYFLIAGSNGTSASSGGSNGVGGQGGYNGTCTVQSPETGEEFQINMVHTGKGSGPNGENGEVGRSGKHGIDGNDMALIDRSASEASKFYEGSSDRKLSWRYVYKAETKSRLNGYKRYVEKENACFIRFEDGEKIDTTQRRASKAQQRTTRKATSEAMAKQSIVISTVLAETSTIFGKESAFLAKASEITTKAAISEEENEAEAEETSENITEEVVILRQKDDNNKLAKYTPESEKRVIKISHHYTKINKEKFSFLGTYNLQC